jgi:hypothetical protein
VKVIQRSEKGLSARQIAKDMGVGKTQIQGVLKKKDAIMKEYEGGVPSSRKRGCKTTGYEGINEMTWQWFKIARSKHIPLSGPMIQEKAKEFAAEMGKPEFKASNGWLDAFRKRHGIGFSCLSGESVEIDDETVQAWQDRLPTLCSGFRPDDVFNLDETGLFYRCLPDKSLVLKGETCKGGKKSKERLTVMFCCSFTGEKLKPLVIGKAAKPRCFKGVDQTMLPVSWKSNRKAWMTSTLFQEWLLQLDRKMGLNKRKILLFLDNATCHMDLPLQNIKLQFLPPNTTSCLQPLDQGIIKVFKGYYRKKLLRHVLSRIVEVTTPSDVRHCVHVLHAIRWIASAWEEVTIPTIFNCFRKAGFMHIDMLAMQEEDPQIQDLDDLRETCEENVEAFITMDDELATSEEIGDKWEEDLLHQAKRWCEDPAREGVVDADRDVIDTESDTESDTEDDDESDPPRIQTYKQAMQFVDDLFQFALSKKDEKMLDAVTKLQSVVEERSWETRQQLTLTSLFSRYSSYM